MYVTLSHLRSNEPSVLHIRYFFSLSYCQGYIITIIWFQGHYNELTLQYKSFAEGSIFIIKDGSFDCEIYLITEID